MASHLGCALAAALIVSTLAPTFPAAGAQTSVEAIEKRYRAFEERGDRAAALAEAKRLEAAVKARSGAQSADYARALFLLANAYRELERFKEAEPLYLSSIALLERTVGPAHPSVGTALNNLAIAYQAEGRYRETEETLRRALAISERSLGPIIPISRPS